MIGLKLGHYEITGSLGKGGMGEVWRARDTKLGREVAIKTLPRELANDSERLARFEREAKLLATLNHAHIASIYGLDEHEGTRFLAMELIEGQTLEERLKSGALPLDETLRLALQVALALEAAHDKGVVHRDLKPANIMVTREGTIKVLDFGLAKAFSGNPQEASPAHSPALSLAMTQQGIILGTAAYMSPEQASGMGTDQRADVWAFGVVVYEMLSGLPLFTGESVPHILAGVLRSDPDWTRLPPNLHPRLQLMLERCLARRPRDRYHSIADARVDLEAVLKDPEARAFASGGADAAAASRPIWRRALPVAAVVVVGLFAAGGAWLAKPASPPPPVVRLEYALPAGQGLRATSQDLVAVSGDGTTIVTNTTAGLYLRLIGEYDGRLVPGTEAGMANPFLSPDGEWVGFYDGQIKKIRSSGGTGVVISPVAANMQGASWSADGTTIVFGQPEGIMEVSANGGTPTLLIEGAELWDPQLLPDGSILYTDFAGVLNGEISLWRRSSGEVTTLFTGERAIFTTSGHLVVTDPAAAPNTLFARTFDLATGEVGAPLLVAENVQMRNNKTHFAVSASGTLAYLYGAPGAAGGSAQPDLYLTRIDREGERRTLGAPPQPYRSPRVSPDGAQVAVEIIGNDGRSSIWVYDLSGEADIRRLTQSTEGNNLRPVWTLDGQRIAFFSDRADAPGIYWQPADGSGPAERLTTADPNDVHLPESFAPDGTLSFAFIDSGFTASSWGIWTRAPDGEIGEFYDHASSNQFGAAFSPDGRWLAYSSSEETTDANAFRIYVERYPRSGERYEVVGNGATWPVWSTDGTELFYRRGFTPADRELNSVSVLAGGTGFRYSTNRSVAIQGFTTYQNYRDFDVLPDGSGWIMLTDGEQAAADTAADGGPPAPERIQVVVNLFRELEQRLPVR